MNVNLTCEYVVSKGESSVDADELPAVQIEDLHHKALSGFGITDRRGTPIEWHQHIEMALYRMRQIDESTILVRCSDGALMAYQKRHRGNGFTRDEAKARSITMRTPIKAAAPIENNAWQDRLDGDTAPYIEAAKPSGEDVSNTDDVETLRMIEAALSTVEADRDSSRDIEVCTESEHRSEIPVACAVEEAS